MSHQTVIDMTPKPEAREFVSGEEDRLSSLASGVALTFASRLFILGGSLGASIIVGRWLGPEGLGALAVLNVTVALALQLGSAGLPSATTYFIARDRTALGPAWANAIIFALAAGILMAAAVVVLAKVSPDIFGGVASRLVAIISISIPFQVLVLLGLNVLLAMDRIALMNVLDWLSSVFLLANAFAVIVFQRGTLETLVIFNTAAAGLVALLTLFFVGRLAREKRSPTRPDMALLRRMLGYGLKFYVSIVAGFVIFRVDLLIVNRFRGQDEAGVYAVATQVSLLLMMLPGVIAALLFPWVASRQDRAADYTVEVTRHTSFVMVILCFAAAAASFTLPLIYGARFADATFLLLIILPGVFFISIESVLVQHFTGTGLPAVIPVFWIVTMTVNLVLNIALVPAWGARAAAVNSTLSYGLIFVLVTVYFCRKTGRSLAEIFFMQSNEFRSLFARFLRRREVVNRGSGNL